jgi:trehalose/maltose hydrolase-like predicted phosphorylase
VTKQADTVLLFFLFPEEEFKRLFERLGYDYTPEMVRKNIDYYDRRTSHGSTLSFIAHAGILAGLDPESSWSRYMVALESDVGDVQGGTTQEGIHMGVMAGTLDLIQRGYLGTDIRNGVLHFDPKPVGNLEGVSFPMRFRGTPLEVELEEVKLTVAAQTDGFSQSIQVGVGDTVKEIKAGERHVFDL